MKKHYVTVKEGEEIMQEGVNLNELLCAKLEAKIARSASMVVIFATPVGDCRNTFSVEDFEVDDDYLYLNNGSYEVNLNLNGMVLIYDDSLDCFRFSKDDVNIFIYFSLDKLN